MKRVLVPLFILVFGLGWGSLYAQEEAVIQIKLSGFDFDHVYRDGTLTDLAGNEAAANRWRVGGNTARDRRRSRDFSLGLITLNSSFHIMDGVDIFMELENKRIEGGANIPFGQDTMRFYLERAYIKLSELYLPELTGIIGLQDIKVDWRGRGSPFFLDLRRAESAWGEVNQPGPNTARDESEPIGITLSYRPKKTSLRLDFFGALVNEGDTVGRDDYLFGLNVDYKLPEHLLIRLGKDSRLHALFTVFTGGSLNPVSNTDQEIWTLGIGGVFIDPIEGLKGLELFGEGYWQFGDAGRILIAGQERTLEARGLAWQIGARYSAQTRAKPWVEVSWSHLSGDDNVGDDEENRFLSYENVNEALIIEDSVVGLDIDTNYIAWKLRGGFKVELGTTPRILNIGALLGIFYFDERMPARPVSPPAGLSRENKLGKELDISMRLDYTANLSFDLNLGFLFDADALELYTANRKERARLFSVGARVSF
jgi:hypothetical protein